MQSSWRIDGAFPRPGDGWKSVRYTSGRRPGVPRIARFGVASGIGFLVTEAILVLCIAASYHAIEVPSVAYASPTILLSDAFAFGIGVSVAFVINEKVTIEGQGANSRGSRAGLLARWSRYQLSSLLGNVLIVAVQLLLLATISLSPALGNVVGAIVSYPVAYAVSMRFVWGVRAPSRRQASVGWKALPESA